MNNHDFAYEAKEELWAIYAWWTCILILKIIALAWFTGRIRLARQVIHSEEDRMWMKGPNVILCTTGGGHPDVDRIRNAHRHDLETVLPYLIITPLWLHTSPPYLVARIILPCYAILSIAYTLIHMRIVNVHYYYKTIISTAGLCIFLYVSTMSMLNHLFIA